MIARFVPEAWVNDNAIEVDAEGPTEWDCTAAFGQLDADYRERLLAEADGESEALDRNDAVQDRVPPRARARPHRTAGEDR